MSIIQSIILGIVQGLTEFLPVSSKGHLVIIQKLMAGFTEPPVLFDAVLHLGTTAVVIFYFRKRLRDIFTNIKLVLLVIVASVPVAIFGYLFKNNIEAMFLNAGLTGAAFIFMGIVLFAADRRKNGNKNVCEITWLDSVIVGIVQVFALVPGISRSGSTISAGIFRDFDKKFAMEFSFLLSIPAILGAAALKIKDAIKEPGPHMDLAPYIVGFFAAAIVGYFTIRLLLNFLQKQRLYIFSIYLWIVGTLVLVLAR